MSENLRDEMDRLRAEVAASRAAHLADYGALDQQIGEMQAERDVLRARLAKAEALADEWVREAQHREARGINDGLTRTTRVHAGELRAALDLASVPEPSDSEPTEAEKIVARFDAMTQDEHEAGIATARERAAGTQNADSLHEREWPTYGGAP